MNEINNENATAGTGISGLDRILNGGLTVGSIYLVEGEPGAGKTTFALQFSLQGLRQNETVLYLALSEMHNDLLMISHSHGWDIEKLHVMEAASEQVQSTSMFDPSEVELGQAIQNLNVLLFRFFESEGEIRRSIAVVKQRSSLHEQSIRELHFTPGGLQIGEPLRQFHGLLSGAPVYTGVSDELIKEPHERS